MTDERDPRLTENGLDNEEDALRELRNERVSARAPSGRYPTAGRMPNAGGRFTQTGMPRSWKTHEVLQGSTGEYL